MIGLARHVTAAVVATLSAVGAASAVWAQDGPPAALVHVDAVVVEPMSQTQPVVGRLVALQSSIVAARVSSAVEETTVEVGDRIEANDVLVRLDDDILAATYDLSVADIQATEARLQASEATLQLYQQDLDRLVGLRGSAAFSQARFDDASREVDRALGQRAEAAAALARARVDLELAELNLSYATIRAPFPGVVVERQVDVGEYVSNGDPVITIVNDQELEVEAAVPSDRIAAVRPGVEVTFAFELGGRYDAVVRAIVPTEDSLTRTRTVRFTPTFGPTDRAMAANQSVIVFIPVGQARDVVTVHKDAVLNGPQGSYVFVVTEGAATIRPVVLGEGVGNRFVVVDGLTPDELVVIRGNERLAPGQPVSFQAG